MPTPKPAPLPELLPCPFCGKPPEIRDQRTATCVTGDCQIFGRAIHFPKWNQRAPSPVNAALLSALQGLVKFARLTSMTERSEEELQGAIDHGFAPEIVEEARAIIAARAAIRAAEATK